MKKIYFTLALLASFISFTACSSDNEEVVEEVKEVVEEKVVQVAGIPLDSEAEANPVIKAEEKNTEIPNINYTKETVNGVDVISIDMTGIQNKETGEWLRLYGTGGGTVEEKTRASQIAQNIWVSIDNTPKGILVINTIDGVVEKKAKNDVVFLVDNSGSMSEEANAIARDIIAWSQKLSQTLDVRFGCVGYDGAIRGAINITTAEELETYLNYSSGTSRTRHFSGDDATTLKNAASQYLVSNSQNENGTAALRFADEQFKFREGANRIYINFTDEGNYIGTTNAKQNFSVEYVNPINKYWETTQGTIHTVYSDDSPYFYGYEEKPWSMSEYTGGTILYTNNYFTGVTLEDLPVSQAMQNSYIIKFTNIANFLDGQPHTIKITILTEDGAVKAEKEFSVIFSSIPASPSN